MSFAPAILAELARIARGVEALSDGRRRGYGPADLLTMEEGASWAGILPISG